MYVYNEEDLQLFYNVTSKFQFQMLDFNLEMLYFLKE